MRIGEKEQQPVLLLIDDSPAIHRLLTFRLKNDGIEFLTAFSGEEGIDLARRQMPSLILVDLVMGGMSGFEVIRTLKDDPATMQIPIIVLSGSHDSEERVRAFEYGAMDFVAKPFDVYELRARIYSAIKMHRLMQMLEQRAQIDALTGLWNRAYFDTRLEGELNSAERKSSQVSLIMCDLDRFKSLNDSYGHQAGDIVLQGFASLLNAELRSCDIPCRYGGEEFGVILPDTSLEQAGAVAERVRRCVEARVWAGYPQINATASFGVTDRGLDGGRDASSWIEAADRALYRAKHSGRNLVCTFCPEQDAGQQLRRAG